MLDMFLGQPRRRRCDGASRRDFLRVGGLGALGLSLPALLRAEASAAGDAPRARAKSVLLVFLGGGISHHDSFDPKPDAIAEIRGKYDTIGTNVPGVRVGELMPKMAQSMDKVALLHGAVHNLDQHEGATNWVLSGRFGSPFGDHPAVGAVVAHEQGFTDGGSALPPYVAVPSNPGFTWELGKSAYLGVRYESFKTGDPNQENFRVRDMSLAEAKLDERLRRRHSLVKSIDRLAKQVDASDQLSAFDQFQQRAATMILSTEARDAFAIEREEAALRDRYGRSTFGQSCLLARRLIESGVRFVTVNFGGWDHHANIFPGLDRKLPELDLGLSSLLDDMTERNLMQDTLVVVMSEFGRSPRVNKEAGRDHWVPAASLLFAGAGVKTGQVIGATDKDGGTVVDRPVKPADTIYTILTALGIDPRKHLYTPDGRPMAILDEGELIHEVFA